MCVCFDGNNGGAVWRFPLYTKNKKGKKLAGLPFANPFGWDNLEIFVPPFYFVCTPINPSVVPVYLYIVKCYVWFTM